MHKTLRAIQRQFIMAWAKQLVYRSDLLAYTLVSLASPLIALAVWYTVARAGGLGGNPQEIVSYYLLIMLVQMLTKAWRGLYLVERILNGEIVEHILRPPVILWDYITNNVMNKLLLLSLPLPLFLAAIILFPQYFSSAIYEGRHIALFLVSVLLASVIWFAFDLSIGLLAFWIDEAQELHGYRFFLMEVTSGVLIPFSAMPETLRFVFSLLPFRYVISAPVEIILGQAEGAAAWRLLAIQVAWMIVFAVVLRTLTVRGLKRYEIPGK